MFYLLLLKSQNNTFSCISFIVTLLVFLQGTYFSNSFHSTEYHLETLKFTLKRKKRNILLANFGPFPPTRITYLPLSALPTYHAQLHIKIQSLHCHSSSHRFRFVQTSFLFVISSVPSSFALPPSLISFMFYPLPTPQSLPCPPFSLIFRPLIKFSSFLRLSSYRVLFLLISLHPVLVSSSTLFPLPCPPYLTTAGLH